jgi:hypothetical protein
MLAIDHSLQPYQALQSVTLAAIACQKRGTTMSHFEFVRNFAGRLRLECVSSASGSTIALPARMRVSSVSGLILVLPAKTPCARRHALSP